ncbi:Aspartate aminotransferase [Levilactobacillus zymae]|uniref:Aspartate aminotransferase n=1 Tax=Levilactobacillus zymae TaxID=267363 RepID=A0A1Y6JZG3_9LACO|nr:Aspartate aminotransferase [Levilactobacillus zymae]
MVNTILKEADLFCPNSVRINFTIYLITVIKLDYFQLSCNEWLFKSVFLVKGDKQHDISQTTSVSPGVTPRIFLNGLDDL